MFVLFWNSNFSSGVIVVTFQITCSRKCSMRMTMPRSRQTRREALSFLLPSFGLTHLLHPMTLSACNVHAAPISHNIFNYCTDRTSPYYPTSCLPYMHGKTEWARVSWGGEDVEQVPLLASKAVAARCLVAQEEKRKRGWLDLEHRGIFVCSNYYGV